MFLARIVIPRSRSRSFESRMHVALQLAVAVFAALAQQGVDQSRLAVVDVGDDGNIADVLATAAHDSTHFRLLVRLGLKTSADDIEWA